MKTRQDNNVTDRIDVVYDKKKNWVIVTDQTEWSSW